MATRADQRLQLTRPAGQSVATGRDRVTSRLSSMTDPVLLPEAGGRNGVSGLGYVRSGRLRADQEPGRDPGSSSRSRSVTAWFFGVVDASACPGRNDQLASPRPAGPQVGSVTLSGPTSLPQRLLDGLQRQGQVDGEDVALLEGRLRLGVGQRLRGVELVDQLLVLLGSGSRLRVPADDPDLLCSRRLPSALQEDRVGLLALDDLGHLVEGPGQDRAGEPLSLSPRWARRPPGSGQTPRRPRPAGRSWRRSARRSAGRRYARSTSQRGVRRALRTDGCAPRRAASG